MLQFSDPLDLAAMEQAAQFLLGQHDFSAFCALKKMKKSPIRDLRQLQIVRRDQEISMIFTGDGFLYNMVRILTGTLLEVGLHRRTAESVRDALESRDRSLSGPAAPAHGLTLWDVDYDGENECVSRSFFY